MSVKRALVEMEFGIKKVPTFMLKMAQDGTALLRAYIPHPDSSHWLPLYMTSGGLVNQEGFLPLEKAMHEVAVSLVDDEYRLISDKFFLERFRKFNVHYRAMGFASNVDISLKRSQGRFLSLKEYDLISVLPLPEEQNPAIKWGCNLGGIIW